MATVNYIWDPLADSYLMETDGSDNTQAVYTVEPEPFGRVISQRRGTTSSYYHYDGLGSTRALTNSSETVTDTNMYDAWGVNRASTGTTVNPFEYVGEFGWYNDTDAMGYYVRRRTYLPKIGRWTSVDSLSGRDGVSKYVRATNGLATTKPPLGLRARTSALASKTLSCQVGGLGYPCGCKGKDCQFELSIRFQAGQPPSMELNSLCFRQSPGEWLPDTAPKDRYQCQSAINRATKGDLFKFTLAPNNKVCTFSAANFPGDSPIPQHPDPVCQAAIVLVPNDADPDINPRSGGCYRLGSPTHPIVKLELDFTIEILCGCGFGGMNSDDLRLKATFP